MYIDGTFKDIEYALKNKFGLPKQTFKEVANDLDNSYYIDNFKNIDWTKSIITDNFKTEPNETSNIKFDLEYFKKTKF